MREITTYTTGTILKLQRFSPEMRAVTIGVPLEHTLRFDELHVPKLAEQDLVRAAHSLDGRTLSIWNTFRPGPAFLVRAYSAKGPHVEERYYSASRVSDAWDPDKPRFGWWCYTLETIIDKARENADTSVRWQEENIVEGMPIDVALTLKLGDGVAKPHFEIHKLVSNRRELSVELENDSLWPFMKFLLYGPGTGFVPFLYYIRYMAERKFGCTGDFPGADVIALMCVKHASELMFDEELREYEHRFPQNLRVVRIVTREKVPGLPLVRLRRPITRSPDSARTHDERRKSVVNMRALEYLVPDLVRRSLRVCGSHSAWHDISDGYAERGLHAQLRSARRETWG